MFSIVAHFSETTMGKLGCRLVSTSLALRLSSLRIKLNSQSYISEMISLSKSLVIRISSGINILLTVASSRNNPGTLKLIFKKYEKGRWL